MRNRPRRLRTTQAIRDLVCETRLTTQDLIAPFFVRDLDDQGGSYPIESMPGVLQYSPERVVAEVSALVARGVQAVILFGVASKKDDEGSEAWDSSGALQRSVTAIKDELGDSVYVISDLCVDEYTSHGHCGVLDDRGHVDNDATLEIYQKVALSHAQAGVDMVAPSGMMDGQVRAIRDALDGELRHDVSIMAYSAKFASAMYGPFREALGVNITGGPTDRKTYQMDPGNGREAIREVLGDLKQGADVVMVKPAGYYLDVISTVARSVSAPVCAYQVSGEYSMIRAAAERGWVDCDQLALESALSIKRAGASMIITYFAGDLARVLN